MTERRLLSLGTKVRWPRREAGFTPIGLERQQGLAGARFASFRRRAAAFTLDFLLVCLIVGAADIWRTLKLAGGNVNISLDIDPFHGWALLSLPLYFGLLTWLGHGMTPGKRLFGIRVVSLGHDHLSLWHSIERSLGYAASLLEGGFGFFQYYIHPNRQTVHDRIAETIVIRDPGSKRRRRGRNKADATVTEEPDDQPDAGLLEPAPDDDATEARPMLEDGAEVGNEPAAVNDRKQGC